ncbi:MAG TPA: hypothetical protein VMU54_04005, partial [Planctomycetota bacterium]|nr:hypothetical protein [Planctomycetota bacterium]
NWSGLASFCIIVSPFFWYLSWILVPASIYFSAQGIKDKRSRNEQDGLVRLYILLALGILGVLVMVLGIAALLGAVAMKAR